MVSATTRNVLGAICATCILCVVIIHSTVSTRTKIVTSDTVMSITENSAGLNQVTQASAFHVDKTNENNKLPQKTIITKYIVDTAEITLIPSTTTSADEVTLPDDELFIEDLERTSISSASASQVTEANSSATETDEQSTVDLPPLNLTRFEMDFEVSNDIGTVLKARRNHVYKTCAKYRRNIDKSIIKAPKDYVTQMKRNRNVLTDHHQMLTFCSVPKSGSTFWKSVFLYIKTGVISNGMSVPRKLDYDSLRSIDNWDLDKADGELYMSFVAVRNPWKRLVSLYQQKIEKYLPKLWKNNFIVKSMPAYRYMIQVCKARPQELQSFADMIECVLAKNFARLPNRHWTSAYEYCDICHMDFNYIIRSENMMKEGTYVMEQAGIKHAGEILKTVRNGTIRDVEKHKPKPYFEYYRDIDEEVIAELREMYKWEIELFDYPDTPFTS